MTVVVDGPVELRDVVFGVRRHVTRLLSDEPLPRERPSGRGRLALHNAFVTSYNPAIRHFAQSTPTAAPGLRLDFGPVDDPRHLLTLQGHTSWVSAVAVIDPNHAITTSHDSNAIIWDLTTGQPTHTLQGHTSWVTGVAVIDANRAITTSHDHTAIIWNLTTGTPVARHRFEHTPNAVTLLDTNRLLIAAGRNIYSMRIAHTPL